MQYPTTPSLSPIPARVASQPWEDLASYISRLATEMGYENPGWLLHPEGIDSTVQPFNLCLLRRKADYQFLERLLYLNEEAMYQLTLHRFAPCLLAAEGSRPNGMDEIPLPLLPRYIFQTFFNPYSASKICPVCLDEEPAYSRLYWNALPVVVCPQHKVFLIDRCPVCQRSIPLFRPSLSHCPHCKKGDYRAAEAILMPEDPSFYLGQALVLRNLRIETTIQDTESDDKERSPLLGLQPWQFFLLLDAFRCVLGPLFPDAPFLQVSADVRMLLRQRPRPQSELSLLEWSAVIATAHWLCTSWPGNFFSFLDAFPLARSERRRISDQRRATGLHRDFGVFYEKWLYQRLAHPAFAFLHGAFEIYLSKRYTGGEVTRRLLPFKSQPEERLRERSYLTKAQAKTVLGVGEEVLQALINQGILRTVKKPMGSALNRTLFLIDKGSAQALLREWEDLIPLDAVAHSFLGITRVGVIELEDAGILLPKRGPNTDGYKFRLYSDADIKQLEKNLLLHARRAFECPADCVSLPRFASLVGIPLVDLLKEIFEGHLTLVEADSHQPLLQRLVLSRDGIPGFLEEFRQRRREKLGFLTSNQVALKLGIGERVLKRWTRYGLLDGRRLAIDGKKPTLLFQKEALETFHSTYIFLEEAARWLGVVPSTVRKYMYKGILHPVVGRSTGDGSNRLLFLRQEIESLLLPEYLTVDEVVSVLGVGRTRVYRLIQSGELPSIRQSVRGSEREKICLLPSDVDAYQQRMIDLAQKNRLPGKEM